MMMISRILQKNNTVLHQAKQQTKICAASLHQAKQQTKICAASHNLL